LEAREKNADQSAEKRGNSGARIIISYVMVRLGEEIAAVMREAVTSRA
jgi:hypothetical protein